MAKQRGVVQLSGRVDNLCYYQQKRVRGGLVRRVNLAMSERVKVGAEYERLRFANSFFGGCSMCASTIFNMTGTRAKFLHLPDRQAIFTNEIRKVQKIMYPSDTGTNIFFVPQSGLWMPYAYERIVKNKMSKFLPSVPYYISGLELGGVVTFVIPAYELTNFCIYNNCKGVYFSLVYNCYIYSIIRNAETGKFVSPDSGFSVRPDRFSWKVGMGDLTISFGFGEIDDAYTFAILSALPIVRESGGRYVTKDTGASCRMIGLL